MTYDYDCVVIGGGAAGLFAASVAQTLGAKTCLIEKNRLGGDCTWYGCVPSKSLLHIAQSVSIQKNLRQCTSENPGKIDSTRVLSHVRSIRDRIAETETSDVFEKRGIKVIMGSPVFRDAQTLDVNDQTIKARRYILCTGSRAFIPSIEGLDTVDFLTNETVFEQKELPKSLIVLGGGPIGIELSQALARLGVTVTVVEMMDQVLVREESECASVLVKKLQSEGITLLTGHKALKCTKADSGIEVELCANGNESVNISAEKLLVAVGRIPNLEDLSLEKAGVHYSRKGVTVNAFLQTQNPHIFACGDVVRFLLSSRSCSHDA